MGAKSINRIEQQASGSVVEFLSARHAAESLLNSQIMAQQFRALKEALNRPVTFERRRYGRIPLPLLLQVTPLDQAGQPLENLTTIVVGRDISPRGVSFFHQQPLPYRRVIVAFEHPEVGHFTMEVDVSWCQFTEYGWYVSGGRQVRVGGQRTAPAPAETGENGDAEETYDGQ
jgi:hypothetical protein